MDRETRALPGATHDYPEVSGRHSRSGIPLWFSWFERRAGRVFWLSWLALWASLVVLSHRHGGNFTIPPWYVATVVGWPLTVPMFKLFRLSYLEELQNANGCRPGAVPFGLAPAGLRGFQDLARNQYGAIDMSRYTHEQWLATRLDFCPKHMAGPEDARFRETTDQFGNHFAVDPCNCGQVVNLERLARAAQIDQHEANVTSVVSGGAALVGKVAKSPNLENFAIGYGLATIIENLVRQGRYRRLYRLLRVHPELQGVWMPRKKFRAAAQPLPLHPPRYPQPTGYTPGGFYMPANPLSDSNMGSQPERLF